LDPANNRDTKMSKISSKRWGLRKFQINNENVEPFELSLKGRVRWALETLMRGSVTPTENPAPRWSAYIFDLRLMGVDIQTDYVFHGGEFAGTHGEYTLVSQVTKIKKEHE